MLTPNTPRPVILFQAALLALLTGSCAKEPEQGSPEASATSGSTVSADTGSTTSADTGVVAADSPSAPTQTPSVGQPSTAAPKIRPSIDPGRKSTPPSPAGSTPPVTARDTPTAAAPAKPASGSSEAGQNEWLSYEASTNTVTFELIGGPNGFQFNGYASGGATLVLPSNANVVMPFINKDGTPHSAEIISGEGPLPNAAVDAAIPRAYTNQLLQGLPQEASDTMRFPVPEKGTYRIFCGVPGHGLSGMWIWMRVDPGAKTPSFGPTKS